MQADLAVDCAATLGEGPAWVDREHALYWVDIKAPAIWRLDASSGAVSVWTPPCRVSAIAPRAGGGLVAASERGFAFIDIVAGGFQLIASPELDLPGNRMNDGKVDQAGSFWAGTMDDAEEAASGSLYRLAPDRSWSRQDTGYRVPNGPAFSLDGRYAYHTDSALRSVYRFPVRDDHTIGPRELFLQFDGADGHPDGMTVDAEGCLWIAFWDDWCVRRFAPDGTARERVEVPVQRPTSCTFGGPALDRLFITSARVGLGAEALERQPLAGGLFVVRPEVGGVVQPVFAG